MESCILNETVFEECYDPIDESIRLFLDDKFKTQKIGDRHLDVCVSSFLGGGNESHSSQR